MAKQTADQHRVDPYREIVLLHDTKTGAINAVGSIDEKTFRHSDVPPISANSKAFMEVKKTSLVRNFMSNLTSQAKEPSRFGFYIVPEKNMAEAVTNLHKLQENPKDADARKAVQPYRVSGRQLDKVKFDKSEMPWDEWTAMGITRDRIEKNITPLMQGKTFPELLDVKMKFGDSTEFSGQYALRMNRDENGVASGNFFSPKVRPEFEDPRWAQEFSQEEKNRLAAGIPLDRTVGVENPLTGEREYRFAAFDPVTNHLELIPTKDIQLEEWAFRTRLDGTQLAELAMGHKAFIQNGKMGAEGVEFSGNIQYDPYKEAYVASDMKFAKPYISPNIREQLTGEQYKTLMEYGAIDGRQLKNRNGENYNSDIRMSSRTNSLEWGNFLGQRQEQNQVQAQAQNQGQSQEQGLAQSKETTQAQGQDAMQWPDNDTHQSQGQSKGVRM